MQKSFSNLARCFQGIEAIRPYRPDSRLKLFYALQLVVALGLLEAALWSSDVAQRGFFWGAMLWIVVTSALSWPGGRQLGITFQGLKQTWWLIPCSIAIGGAAVLAAWSSGHLHPAFGPSTTASHYFAYALWALFQQFILQSYFFLRLEPLLGGPRRAVVASALLFSAVHIPNALLALVTFAGGLFLCELFRRYRNIYALGTAHAVLGLCIAVTTPSALNHGMRVGQGFFDYRSSPSSLYALFPSAGQQSLHQGN